MSGVFVGFGFGAIQAGLFAFEAFRSRAFGRLVVAEVVPETVAALRADHGRYTVNVATMRGIEQHEVTGIEILNPQVEEDRRRLIAAVSQATEIATALPSVRFYDTAGPASVASILAEGLASKTGQPDAPDCVVYTAENHNHAAEILGEVIGRHLGDSAQRVAQHFQCLNTVIGKMSGIVSDEAQIREQGLARIAGSSGRCFLVEEFNRILISKIRWPAFRRGISVFEEKQDLLPFEEAKLYGHNAVHALLGYLGWLKGCVYMTETGDDPQLRDLGYSALLEESGGALRRRYGGVDPLFTLAGYKAYADDLLERMLNPHLRDTVERITRDPRRKLGWDDRLIGTIRMAMKEGIVPQRYALGAAAAVRLLNAQESGMSDSWLDELWGDAHPSGQDAAAVKELLGQAARQVEGLLR